MTGFRFERDDPGIIDVVNGPAVGEYLTSVAVEARERIRRRAPHGRDAFFNYWQSVRYVPAQITTEGLVAAVGSDSPGWHLAEYGTTRLAPIAPIRRGCEEIGLQIEGGRT